MNAPTRELYRPSHEELRGAIEILLASSLPQEARRVVRELEQQTVRKEAS